MKLNLFMKDLLFVLALAPALSGAVPRLSSTLLNSLSQKVKLLPDRPLGVDFLGVVATTSSYSSSCKHYSTNSTTMKKCGRME